MKKWIIRLAVVALVFVLGVSLVTRLTISKDLLVEQIEGAINSRVQIGELDISLLRFPAKVTLNDVVITTRDAAAEGKVAHGERTPLDSGVLSAEEISFEVTLSELISKKIYVDSLKLDGLHANITLHKDGTNSLDPLFAEPEGEKTSKTDRKKEDDKKPKSFNAKDKEDFVTELKSVEITNVSCDLLIEDTGLVVKGNNGSLKLSDIRVDPNQLEVVNQADLRLALSLVVFSDESLKVEYGEIGIDGAATTQLFDAKSGEIDPDVAFDFQLSDASYLNTRVPYIEKIWKKGDVLEKVGVRLGQLPEKATFGRSRKITGLYKRGRVDLHNDISVLIDDWEVAANRGSWLESGDETHEFFVDLCASEKASSSLVKHSEKLVKKLPREMRENFQQSLHGNWLKDGKLTLQLHTSKKLSSPKVRSLTKLPAINSLLKEATKKGALDFLLKKLK